MTDLKDEFQAPKKELNVAELQGLVVEAQKARADYDEAKKESNTRWDHFKGLQNKLLSYLKEADLSKFHVKGQGTAYIRKELKAKLPKEVDTKLGVFDWLKEKHGEEVLNSMLTINAQSFASFYREEQKSAESKGELLKIPGVEAPEIQESIGFRKDSK